MGSFNDNLDKRTKEIEKKNVGKGGNQALVSQQEALTQYQAIQSERRNNLVGQQLNSNSSDQQFDTAVQAANLGTGTMNTLGKYGIKQGRPLSFKKSDIKVKPNNIVINNTTNNVINGGGGGDNNPGKFKAWLSKLVAVQKENTNKQRIEFERRESSLAKSAGKMLSRIEVAGKTVAESFNPNKIGTTVSNQLKILLLIFGARFLGKYWDKILPKVLDIATFVKKGVDTAGDFFHGAADYFGFTEKGKRNLNNNKGFYSDLITFLGGEPGKKGKSTLLDIGKLWIEDLGKMLDLKIKQFMSLRSEAIKNIKFPSLEVSNLNKGSLGDIDKQLGGVFSGMLGRLSGVLTNVSTYLGDILTALVDPSSAMHKNLRSKVNNIGLQSSMSKSKNYRNKTFSSNTDYGEADIMYKNTSGRRNYTLNRRYLNSTGGLNGSTVSQVSQSMDILGTLNDAKTTGKIDTARMAAGFQRLQDSADSKGIVTVDPEFISRFYNRGTLASLVNSGDIKPKKYKFVKVKRSWEEKSEEENASGFIGGAAKSFAGRKVARELAPYMTSIGGNMVGSGLAGDNSVVASGAAGLVDWIPGMRTINDVLITGYGGVKGWANNLVANDYTLKLVPAEDNSYGSAAIDPKTGKPMFVDLYTLNKNALNKLSYENFGVNRFDSSDEASLNGVRSRIIRAGGGEATMKNRYKRLNSGSLTDFETLNPGKEFREFREFENTKKRYEAEQEALWVNSAPGKFVNNTAHLFNKGIDHANESIETITDFVRSAGFSIGASDGSWKGASLFTNGSINVNRQVGIPFNVTAASNIAICNASRNIFSGRGKPLTRPIGYCARYVRLAIMGGLGITEKRLVKSFGQYPGSAYLYINYLGRLGFEPIGWSSYSPQIGDILVEGQIPGHPHGHICIKTKIGWVSDFVQKDMWGGSSFRRNKLGIVFRHINRKSNLDELENRFINDKSEDDYQDVYIDNEGNFKGYGTVGGDYKDAFGNTLSNFDSSGYNKVDFNSYNNVQNWGRSSSNELIGMDATVVASPIMNYLIKELGLTKEQAAGVVGNLYRESSLGTNHKLDAIKKDNNGKLVAGIAQWNGSRLEDLQNFAKSRGLNWGDLSTQLEFLKYELTGGYKDVLNKLKSAKTTDEASFIFTNQFEKPKGHDDPNGEEVRKRQEFARSFLDNYQESSSFEDFFESSNTSSAIKNRIQDSLKNGLVDKKVLVIGDRWIAKLQNEINKAFVDKGAKVCNTIGFQTPTLGLVLKNIVNNINNKIDIIIIHIGYDLKGKSNEEISRFYKIIQGNAACIPIFFCSTNNPKGASKSEIEYIKLVNDCLNGIGINILDIRKEGIGLEVDGSCGNPGLFISTIINCLLEGSKKYNIDSYKLGMTLSTLTKEESESLKGSLNDLEGASYLKIPYLDEISEEERRIINSKGTAAELVKNNKALNNYINRPGGDFDNFAGWFSSLTEVQQREYRLTKEAENFWNKLDEKYRDFEFLPKGVESLRRLYVKLSDSERSELNNKINSIVSYRKNLDKNTYTESEELSDYDRKLFKKDQYAFRSELNRGENISKTPLDLFRNNQLISEKDQKDLINAIRNYDFKKADSIISRAKATTDNEESKKLIDTGYSIIKSKLLAGSQNNLIEGELGRLTTQYSDLSRIYSRFSNNVSWKDHLSKVYEERTGKNYYDLSNKERLKLKEEEEKSLANSLDKLSEQISQQEFAQEFLTDGMVSLSDSLSDLEKIEAIKTNKRIAQINQGIAGDRYYYDPLNPGEYFNGMNKNYSNKILREVESGDYDEFFSENNIFTAEAANKYFTKQAEGIRARVAEAELNKLLEKKKLKELGFKGASKWMKKQKETANMSREDIAYSIDEYLLNHADELEGLKLNSKGELEYRSDTDKNRLKNIALKQLIKNGTIGLEGFLLKEGMAEKDRYGDFLIQSEDDLTDKSNISIDRNGNYVAKYSIKDENNKRSNVTKKISEMSESELRDVKKKEQILGRLPSNAEMLDYDKVKNYFRFFGYSDVPEIKLLGDNETRDVSKDMMNNTFSLNKNDPMYQFLSSSGMLDKATKAFNLQNLGNISKFNEVNNELSNKIIAGQKKIFSEQGLKNTSGRTFNIDSDGASSWFNDFSSRMDTSSEYEKEQMLKIKNKVEALKKGDAIIEVKTSLPGGGEITRLIDKYSGTVIHTFIPEAVKLKRDEDFRKLQLETGKSAKKIRENTEHFQDSLKLSSHYAQIAAKEGVSLDAASLERLVQMSGHIELIAKKVVGEKEFNKAENGEQQPNDLIPTGQQDLQAFWNSNIFDLTGPKK